MLDLSRSVMERDKQICSDLFEHRVLTTHQIEELYFDTGPVARRRMVSLYRYGLVDRFRPHAIGSAPCHYVLDKLGARIVAADRGVPVHSLDWRKEDVEAWPYRRDLWHLVDTNGFFTRHVWACRRRGEYRLTEWWSERRTAERWESIVQPDGFGRLESPCGSRSFFLELDRASEGSARLRGKLEGFRRLSGMGNRPDAVLFVVPDSKREVFVRPHLDAAGMTIATTTWDQVQSDPLGSIWLPIRSERRRRLLELPVAR